MLAALRRPALASRHTALPAGSARLLRRAASHVALLGCVGWCWERADRAMHIEMLQDKLRGVATVEAAVLGQSTPSEVRATLCGAAAVVALEFSASLLDPAAPPPMLLQSPGSGTDRFDLPSLEAQPGLTICNATGHETAMAEYLLCGMLAHAHDWVEASASFREGSWRMSGRQGGPLHRELSSATLGIVGLGLTGRAFAQRANAFGMRVLACNRTPPPPSEAHALRLAAPVLPLDRLDELIAECDYLALTVALTPETSGLLGAAQLARAKRGCVILNASRATLCDEAALYDALARGHLGGAILDVWWRAACPLPAKPRSGLTNACAGAVCGWTRAALVHVHARRYPDSSEPSPRPSRLPFHELPRGNCIMTPHASCWSREMLERRWDGIASNLRAAVAGDTGSLRNVVRPAASVGG